MKVGRRGVVVIGGMHARKGHAMSSSSMGVLLMLLLFATVVSSSGVDGLSDVEGGEALSQSHAAGGLLHGLYVGSSCMSECMFIYMWDIYKYRR